jgi:hypothetical protein
MLKRPYHFGMVFFQDIEDREKKKSTVNATRQEKGPTMWAKILDAWWGPTSPSWFQ